MAALPVNNPTLADLAKATDPDGKMASVVEILNEQSDILDDMTWLEGNLPTGMLTTIRSGIPDPTWRKLYGGVQPNKSSTVQVTDHTGELTAYAEVDKKLADMSGDVKAFRLMEDRPHIEGMNQKVSRYLFNGNEATEPEAFTGLGPRLNSLTAASADNIVVGGGAGTDNASIYLVVWSPNTVHGIIPKGSKAGLQVNDKGHVTIESIDGAGGRMEAYRTHYQWDVGLCVRDWRFVARAPNIDKSALTYNAATGADLPNLMFQLMDRIPNLSMGRAAFYMSRNTRTFLRTQIPAKLAGSTLGLDMVGGKMVNHFQGIPVRICAALSADEALVS